MAVIELQTQRREPYLGGQSFGDSGAYERIDGQLLLAVDPSHPANSAITDLALAPRDGDGCVRFRADFCLLQPADPECGNGRLLLELPNRGRKLVPRHFNRAPTEVPPTANVLPGDGFLFRRGYAAGWIGWQWDVVRSEALMGLQAPEALVDGRSIPGQTILRFQPNVAHRAHLLADRVHQPYPAADLEDPDAVLTVRESDDAEARVIPRAEWRFAREVDGEAQPADDHVFLSSGFEPGKLYELVYTTNRSPVVGCGLLAVRDVASFLRYSGASDNPCAGRLERVYGFGMSQTGRMLRHFLYLGLNQDEEGRIAYDGLIPHVGGARRGEFNHRYGQPSVQATPGLGHLPPFADAPLLARQRESGSMPKVMQTNSSAEYWRGDCALMHIDVSGTRDLPPEPDTRAYHFAGTQHGPGAVPLTNFNPNDGGRGRYGFNAVDYTPLLRAALVNLDRWVNDGVEPPSSAHPRVSDSTAVERSAVLERFRALPGMHLPDPALLPVLREVDCGPDAARGLPRFPPVEGAAYPALVSAVDVDLNEQAGIRLPHLTVPVASYTGWNPRHPETGSPEQMMPMQGSTFFFARTRAEREASGDPRMSIEERYQSRDGYLERVRAAAIELAAQRYILEEDIDVVVSDAAARYDTAMGVPNSP